MNELMSKLVVQRSPKAAQAGRCRPRHMHHACGPRRPTGEVQFPGHHSFHQNEVSTTNSTDINARSRGRRGLSKRRVAIYAESWL